MKNFLRRMMRYDPAAYWNSRENPNNSEGTADSRVAFDTSYISAGVRDRNSVLELGPGIGRTLSAYSPGRHITTLDLSRRYAGKLEEKASALGLTLAQHYLSGPADRFPFEDKAFQVGVISQVLLHIPPEYLQHTLSELIRTCMELTIITAYAHGAPTVNPRVKHVFNHDYFTMISSMSCEMNHVVMNEGRLCFRVSPKM